MIDLLPSWPLLSAFLAASVLLALTPGPGVFYIVTRSLAQGRASGIASVAGVALGNLGNALGACIGLAAVFALSAAAFMIAKYAGAAYLVYLGVRALRAQSAVETGASAAAPPARLLRDGFIVALLNPKTAIFFAAFLPQFMDPAASPMLQGVLLACLFVGIAAVTDTAYALAAGTLAPLLKRAGPARAAGRYLTGGAFIGLGLLAGLPRIAPPHESPAERAPSESGTASLLFSPHTPSCSPRFASLLIQFPS
ncbi:MAG TPA: LysE family translocator [Steroidobacter sp.]|jgi:threonine/homoserine/homoserine lactone efflux protein|nr:LysE family translocator [Steroidobacter sp.]